MCLERLENHLNSFPELSSTIFRSQLTILLLKFVTFKLPIKPICWTFETFFSILTCVDTWTSAYSICLARLVAEDGKVELSVKREENSGIDADELRAIGKRKLFYRSDTFYPKHQNRLFLLQLTMCDEHSQ